MKKIYSLLLLGAFVLSVPIVNAQNKIPEEYDRSSITWVLLVKDSERLSQKQIDEFHKIAFSEKFYDNSLDYKVMRMPNGVKDVQSFVTKKLNEEKIAHKIIAKWYNRQDDGTLNQGLIHERGMYNAIDEDVIKASNSKRGNAELEDYGNRLINKSYIFVLDYYKIKTAKELSKKDYHGWKGYHNSYLFQVDFNEDAQYTLYDNAWIYGDDTPEVKAKKRDSYFELNFPLKFIGHKNGTLDATQANPSTTLGKFIKQKTNEELFTEMIQKGHDNTVFLVSKDYEAFRVKTTLKSKKPLTAKIGKKEDLKVDQRFFVYEYRYNEKKNETYQKRKGVVRVKKVADNRQVATGNSKASNFYQTAGYSLDEGMLLQQRLDWGILAYAGYEVGEIGGANFQLAYRVGSQVGIPALYAYGELGIDSKPYNSNYSFDTDFAFARYNVGLAKGFYFAKNFELLVNGAYGIENHTGSDMVTTDMVYLRTYFVKFGGTLAMNLLHNFQIFGSYNIYAPFGTVFDANDKPYTQTWTDLFPGRSGGSLGFGARVMF